MITSQPIASDTLVRSTNELYRPYDTGRVQKLRNGQTKVEFPVLEDVLRVQRDILFRRLEQLGDLRLASARSFAPRPEGSTGFDRDWNRPARCGCRLWPGAAKSPARRPGLRGLLVSNPPTAPFPELPGKDDLEVR